MRSLESRMEPALLTSCCYTRNAFTKRDEPVVAISLAINLQKRLQRDDFAITSPTTTSASPVASSFLSKSILIFLSTRPSPER